MLTVNNFEEIKENENKIVEIIGLYEQANTDMNPTTEPIYDGHVRQNIGQPANSARRSQLSNDTMFL